MSWLNDYADSELRRKLTHRNMEPDEIEHLIKTRDEEETIEFLEEVLA